MPTRVQSLLFCVLRRLACARRACCPRVLCDPNARPKGRHAAAGENAGVAVPERKRLTIKGHLIESHIPKEILKHGSLGFFAVEACESFHAVDNKTRRMLRTVTNPEAFAQAMLRYRTQYQMLAPETREIKRRKTNRKSTGDLPAPF